VRTVTLGKTGIKVPKNGFGALPIQRILDEDAVKLMHRAYEGGIRYFDTARMYTDREHKVGLAFSHMRDKVFIATKTLAQNAESFWKDLEKSLEELKTDYIDVYQFHNPSFCPKPGDGTGLYEAMVEAKQQGKIRHIGITNHRITVAKEAVESGLYETLQFPFSYISTDEEKELVKLAEKNDVGFVAMKGLAGGLLTNSKAAYAFMTQYENVLPIWGVQRERELEEFLSYQACEPTFDEDMSKWIEKDKNSLKDEFCRGCGYCMPCPAEIEINNCARMSLMVRRAPAADYMTEAWQAKMKKIDNCINCGQCKTKCPYGLDTPNLLKKNWEDYKELLEKM
jgi:aryl-alcohol dehydrogenase-like predicted oxidoreductase